MTAYGGGETVVQTVVGTRFGVDCKVNSKALVGHVIIALVPERMIVSCGVGNERLNTMPLPLVPPPDVVPYNVLPDKIKLACGESPSGLFVKGCRVVKPVPLVVTANSVPSNELPPLPAVPNRVLPDKINPAYGLSPSLPPVKGCRFIKPMPLVVTTNTVPPSLVPPESAVPYRVLPDKINPASGVAPSLSAVKVCRFVKPVPSVLTANTVPLPLVPPLDVVPYRVLPDKINPPSGVAPSLLVNSPLG